MRALRDGARTQGDRKGSPLLETAWQADPPVYSRGWACPCPAALHSFFHSPAASFMVARRALLPPFSHAASSYEHVCITEQQRSAAVSRQELVKRNRQVADTDAGRVIDGVSDGSSGAGDPELANPFRTYRVEMWIVFIDPGHIDRANIGIRRDVVLCEVVVHVVAEARVHDALLV